MPVLGFDHIALSTPDLPRFLDFYERVGFGVLAESDVPNGDADKYSIVCGDNKINVRQSAEAGKARTDAHLAVVWEGGIDSLLEHLRAVDVAPALGPVRRLGGRAGATMAVSVYLRDPDDNVLEYMSYDQSDMEKYPGLTREEERLIAYGAK